MPRSRRDIVFKEADFSEAAYLALNPDVASAVAGGLIASGWQHYERWGRAEGRATRRTPLAQLMGDAPTFCLEYPGHQNSLDIFGDTWTTAMPEGSGLAAGELPHFVNARVQWGADVIGGLAGKSILELGPFEAYDTYTFERLGAAAVVSIESNTTNFLKCLVIKNIFGLRTAFLLGDFVRFLEKCPTRYDVCWMSGVLYHMVDPIQFLTAAARVADALFIWTHCYDDAIINADAQKRAPFRPDLNKAATLAQRDMVLHYRSYGGVKGNNFSGGSEEHSFWLTRDDILHILKVLGYERTVIGHDEPDHVHGPSCSIVAFR
jgi:hypothetical protein